MMQWRRVFAHRSAGVGLVLVALALLTALLAPLLAPHDPVAQNRQASGKPPGTTVGEPLMAPKEGGIMPPYLPPRHGHQRPRHPQPRHLWRADQPAAAVSLRCSTC